jgi:hypothetical protein
MASDQAAELWREQARQILTEHRGRAAGWGYHRGGTPCVEPTVLADLALLPDSHGADGPAAARRDAAWLETIQQRDGSVGVSERLGTPGWGTPYALLLWQAVRGHDAARRRATAWLLAQKGEPTPASADPERVVGHDTTLIGWPWVARTHSWIEPTALAILALRGEGLASHPRVREGIRVIRDRAIVTGGWNCGNKAVYGRPLRPQPGPTGLALLALSQEGPRPALVDDAIAYLHQVLPGVRAAESLGWGLLGLRAWEAWPSGANDWLRESFVQAAGRIDAAPRLALLLLAAEEHAWELFHG